ncbi:MAG: hypothetical protein QNJ88_09330 [Acidimicrobiia bacterium]|nr:hypothetical protein [Acidimicrobiia bacterium]
MTTKTKDLLAWVLALLGPVVAVVAVFAETFGLGSGNGQFGRWQVSGVLAGCLLMAAGLVLSGNARVVWKRLRRVDGLRITVIQLVALLVGLVAVAWVLSPSWLDEWDCSDPTVDGWVTCTYYANEECGHVLGRFEYHVKDGPPEGANINDGPGCNL